MNENLEPTQAHITHLTNVINELLDLLRARAREFEDEYRVAAMLNIVTNLHASVLLAHSLPAERRSNLKEAADNFMEVGGYLIKNYEKERESLN